MLARRPHILVQRNVRDAAGRIGIAVTDTTGPAIKPPGRPLRRTLIFDPATGDLLASVQTDATSPPNYATPPDRQSATLSYALYLTRQYTPDVHNPKPDCTLPRQSRARLSDVAGRDRPASCRTTSLAGRATADDARCRMPTGNSPGGQHA
jgi:hypothetical protein